MTSIFCVWQLCSSDKKVGDRFCLALHRIRIYDRPCKTTIGYRFVVIHEKPRYVVICWNFDNVLMLMFGRNFRLC